MELDVCQKTRDIWNESDETRNLIVGVSRIKEIKRIIRGDQRPGEVSAMEISTESYLRFYSLGGEKARERPPR